ncbi:MAG: hypothetical protein HUJ61_05435 [Bacilli bacterium]|nr:hypothetical protein [Bacilli bacterium]
MMTIKELKECCDKLILEGKENYKVIIEDRYNTIGLGNYLGPGYQLYDNCVSFGYYETVIE